MIIKLILVAIVLVGFAIAGIAVKMFFVKGHEFKKSCGSVDPHTGAKMGCSCGGGVESAGTCENRTV